MGSNKKQNTYILKQFGLLVLIAFSFFWRCQNTTNPTPKKVEEIPLPNTVETVAEKWLSDYNSNRFAEAKKLSTTATIEMIDTIKNIIAEMGVGVIPFKISNLKCTTQVDSASCAYQYHEEEYEFQDSLFLLQENGQWLVDMPLLEDDGLKEGDLEKLFEMSEETLEKILRQQ